MANPKIFHLLILTFITGLFIGTVESDYALKQPHIKQPIKISPGEFKEAKCIGVGVRFEGGYFKVTSATIKPLPTTDMTFLAWIRVRNTDKITTIYSTMAADGGKQALEVRPSDNKINGYLKWTVKKDKTTTIFDIESDSKIPSGIWTHIVAKYDGTQGRAYLFINGDKITKEKDAPKAAKLPWGTDVVIGGLTDDKGKVTFDFTGGMIGIRIVEKPLTHNDLQVEISSCKPQKAVTPYRISVCTADKLFSGTYSNVYIKLYGTKGQFGETLLGSSFGSGCSKAITIYSPAIGSIKRISVRKDAVTFGVFERTWVLEKISISAEHTPDKAETYTFNCKNCKFSTSDGLQRVIEGDREVHGGWASWSDWSGCGTGMCGGDRKVRTRACTNPEPSDGGKKCKKDGRSFGMFQAETQACPVDGGWGAWTSWSECQKPCGGTKVTRTRKCDNPVPFGTGAKKCTGPDSETKMDCIEPCEDWPVHGNWAEWGQWSACSKTCGGGTVTRKRTCTNPAPLRGGSPCEGDDTETATECTEHCPIDGQWSAWGNWTECSATCGPGQETRERECTNPPAAFGGKPCPGQAKETKTCNKMDCPNYVNGKWGTWSPWSACSETQFCDQGEKKRTRKCDSPEPSNGGELCPGLDTEEDICPTTNCKPVNGDSIKVKPQSYLAKACNVAIAYFAGDKGTKTKDIPVIIFNKYLTKLSDIIKTSYFGQTKEIVGDEEVTKYCFQPAKAIPIITLTSVFKEYSTAKALPDFDPKDVDKTNGLSVSLKKDWSLFSVEFSLADSEKYSPFRNLEIQEVNFVFRERPGKSEIVAYGKHTFINNVFAVEVVPGPTLTGKTSGSTTLGELVEELSPKTEVYAAYIHQAMGETIREYLDKRLQIMGVTKVPVKGLTEVAKNGVNRIAGTVTSNKDKQLFRVETLTVFGPKFVIGLTAEKTNLKDTLEKVLLRNVPDVFGELVDTMFGIAYSPITVVSNDEVSMQNEPLKRGFKGIIKEGLFVAFVTKFPEQCKSLKCQIAKAIVGTQNDLLITGNFRKDGIDLMAAIINNETTEKPKRNNETTEKKVRIGQIEFWIKTTFMSPKATFVILLELLIPVTGEVYKDNILQPRNDIIFDLSFDLSTTSEVGFTANLQNWVWRKAFGISYLSFTDFYLSIAASAATGGFPTRFALGTSVMLGHDCNKDEDKDFEKDGHCIRGSLDLNISPTVTDMYFIGELSSVTVGKIVRMVGRNTQLPEIIANTGFEGNVMISYSSTYQLLKYSNKPKEIYAGLMIMGKLNLFGVGVDTQFYLMPTGIMLDVVLDPIDVKDQFRIVRSLTDKTKGPMFSIKATTTKAQVFLHGAVTIFGVSTEIKFELKPRYIEAQTILALTVGKTTVTVDAHITAAYKHKTDKDDECTIQKFSFMATLTLKAKKNKIEDGANNEAKKQVSTAAVLLKSLKETLKNEKEKCKKRVTVYCEECQNIKCQQVTESCNNAFDSFKNYIGGAGNQFGAWFVGMARKVASTFKTERERRSAEFFPGRTQLATRLRRKRFVGRYMCQQIAPKICAKSRTFCEATCKLPKHLHKGLCKGLDLSHKNLYKSEQAFSWLKKTIPKYMLKIHEVSFELQIVPSLVDTSVTAFIDFTFMEVRRKITAQLTLQDAVNMGIVIANKVMDTFRKMVSPRFTQPVYDRPDNVGDFKLGAPFRITNGNKMCMTSPNDKNGATYGTGLCANENSMWVFTLTGELMNIGAEKCLTFTGTGKTQTVAQQDCQIGNRNQHFYCENKRIHPSDNPHNCLVQKAKSVQVVPCTTPPEDETKEFEIPPEEEWTVDGRMNVCENYVKDVALNKPAEQSSTFSTNDMDTQELAEIQDSQKVKDIVLKKVGPELAVDGNMNFDVTAGSCARTSLSQDPWWRVDLQAEHVVTDVSIQTGEESAYKVEALENFEIRVGMKKQFDKNPMCGIRVKGIHVGELWTSTCDPSIPGQYVSVQSFGMYRLTLCEVAVYTRRDNQGKCSSELSRRRSEIATVCHRDRIFKRPMTTYGIKYD